MTRKNVARAVAGGLILVGSIGAVQALSPSVPIMLVLLLGGAGGLFLLDRGLEPLLRVRFPPPPRPVVVDLDGGEGRETDDAGGDAP